MTDSLRNRVLAVATLSVFAGVAYAAGMFVLDRAILPELVVLVLVVFVLCAPPGLAVLFQPDPLVRWSQRLAEPGGSGAVWAALAAYYLPLFGGFVLAAFTDSRGDALLVSATWCGLATGPCVLVLVSAVDAQRRKIPTWHARSRVRPRIQVRRGDADPSDLGGSFEKVLNSAAGFADLRAFRSRLAEAELRTARVLVGGHPVGTGFLVADDLLLTNWHVVQDAAKDGVAEFDLVGADSRSRRVAFDDLVCFSSFGPLAEELGHDGPAPGHWDAALVRLTEPVGRQPLDGPGGRGDLRGHFRLESGHYAFRVDEPIIIVGHPLGRPLQLSFAVPGGAELCTSGARVRYLANTEPGSSGSPVFNRDFRVIALHQAAGTSGVDGGDLDGCFNQGVPIPEVVAWLRREAPEPVLFALSLDGESPAAPKAG